MEEMVSGWDGERRYEWVPLELPPTPFSAQRQVEVGRRQSRVRAKPLYMEKVDERTVQVHGKLLWRGTEAEWAQRRERHRTEPSLLLSTSLDIVTPPSRDLGSQLATADAASKHLAPGEPAKRMEGASGTGHRPPEAEPKPSLARRLRNLANVLSMLCPPFPASIYRKVAFPAPVPTYTFLGKNSAGALIPLTPENREQWPLETVFQVQYRWSGRHRAGGGVDGARSVGAHSLQELEGRLLEGCLEPARDAEASGRLAAIFLPLGSQLREQRGEAGDGDPGLVLFFHGNASDLGTCIPFLYKLRRKLGLSVAAVDYWGYGPSAGRPGQGSTEGEADAALRFSRSLGFPLHKTLLLGFSLGSAPAARLAALHPGIAGLILAGPFVSPFALVPPLRRCLFPGFNSDYRPEGENLQTYERVPLIKARTLLVHGEEDRIVPLAHSRWIFAQLPKGVPPLFLPHTGHNDLLERPEMMGRMVRFLGEVGLGRPYPALRQALAQHLLLKSRGKVHEACVWAPGPEGVCEPCRRRLVPLFFPDGQKLASVQISPALLRQPERLRLSFTVEPVATAHSLWAARFCVLLSAPPLRPSSDLRPSSSTPITSQP